jgi:uncharacterized peroxidase-related enzyme
VNKCNYCVAHHSVPLGRLLRNDGLLIAIQTLDKVTLESTLSTEDNILIWLAEKITREPHNVSEEDINSLREHGFNDEQILHVVLVINYFNFVNRNVLALGIELETDYEMACK